MTDTDFTLRQFFAYDDETIPHARLSALESGAAFSHVKDRVLAEARGIEWPSAFGEIMKKAGDLLVPDIPGIMAAAWNKYRLLRKYLDKDQYPPDKTVLVSLAEHTVKSEHHPYVEVFINGRKIRQVDFQVTVSLTFKGLTLKIRDGRILEILTGSYTGRGSLSCENCVLIERETAPFPLPGAIKLGDGVPISP